MVVREDGEPGTAVVVVWAMLWKLGLLDSEKSVADPFADQHNKILELARSPKRIRQPTTGLDNDF